MSRTKRPAAPVMTTLAAGVGLAIMPALAVANEPVSGNTSEPLSLAEGAKALVCEELGFLSIVRNLDGSINSPQFPHVEIQHTDGLFALSATDVDVRGMAVSNTSFLEFGGDEHWVFTGFNGTKPFEDNCKDITAELAFSFAKIAVSASWGMPHIEQRVRLFDALQDDLETRLELASTERDDVQTENAKLERQIGDLQESMDDLVMAVCEFTGGSSGMVTEVSYAAGRGPALPNLDPLRDATTAFGGCVSEAILTSTTRLAPR